MNNMSESKPHGTLRGLALAGIRVVELAGMGPGPHAAMVLADLGADVVRVQRPGQTGGPANPQLRGRRFVEADLKDPTDHAEVRRLIDRADVLIEGFRPGVTERLGLGPEVCSATNPALIYLRMTGWGQTGPRAQEAGHDINYIGLVGLLHAIGPAEQPPVPPLNLVGDYGGGSMPAVIGVLAALIERHASGRGQVIDAAIVNGAAQLAQAIWSMRADGRWSEDRGTNIFDGSAPFYRTYRCADGRYVAVGALEPEFFAEMLAGLDISPETVGAQRDKSGWPAMHSLLSEAFAQRSRDEWSEVFAGTDACVTPVLSMVEAASDGHLSDRGVFIEIDGVTQPAPAPHFSRTPQRLPSGPPGRSETLNTVWRD
ncbi:CoA transferase [Mycolicibacter senuensis]|nr:CaiB/BaiF CoA-transferase family protein [Mycolicibacter senuensis]RAV03949.1 CoA transferase [Mycolicibacter senuensis]